MKETILTDSGEVRLNDILYINREKKILYDKRAVRLDITEELPEENEELEKIFNKDKWFFTGRFIINISRVTYCAPIKDGGEIMFNTNPVRQLFLDRKSCGDDFKILQKMIIWEQKTSSSKNVDPLYLKKNPYKRGNYVDLSRPNL